MKGKLVAGAIRALLVLLFAYTGFSKLFALKAFTGNMYNQPIPHWLALPLIGLIPLAEILAAAFLLFEKTQRIGLWISFALLALFTGYVGVLLLHFFPRTPCSCGGIFRGMSWQQHFWINLLLFTLTGFALFAKHKRVIPSPLNLQ